MRFYYVTDKEKYAEVCNEDQELKRYCCEECEEVYQVDVLPITSCELKGQKKAPFYRGIACYLANKQFQDMLVKYEITGYELKDINITEWTGRNGRDVDMDNTIKEIVIKGRAGHLCNVDGTEVKSCPKCGMVDFDAKYDAEGFSVSEEQWDKSDIFIFSNLLGLMFCSERLKEACEAENIENIVFIPIEDFRFGQGTL